MRIEDHWRTLTKGKSFYRGGDVLASAVSTLTQSTEAFERVDW